MTENEAREYIGTMLETFYKKDQFLLNHDVAERSITHRMGMYLQQILEESFDVDCEYNRMGKKEDDDLYLTEGDYFAKTVCLSEGMVSDESDVGSRVYPDIIVHKRGTAENVLIIEVKVAGKVGNREHDYKKLKAYKEDLQYEHAFFIELYKNKERVVLEKIDEMTKFDNFFP